MQKLVDAGVEIAKQEVLTLGAFDSGELHDSLDGLMYTDGAHGIIFTELRTCRVRLLWHRRSRRRKPSPYNAVGL